MKPHPRIRKTAKWGGGAVTVLLVVIGIGSGGVTVNQIGPDWGAELRAGCVTVGWMEGGYNLNWTVTRWDASRTPQWEFSLNYESFAGYSQVVVPPGLLSGSVTAVGWRLDVFARRRAGLHLCPKGNYDRTGLAEGAVCPECGRLAQARA